jgi:opacity protein-like surface antigen
MASSAAAQAPQAPSTTKAPAPVATGSGELTSDIAITYSYSKFTQKNPISGGADIKTTYHSGWQLSAGTRFNHAIGIYAELGQTFTNAPSKSVLSYAGGIRFQTNRREKFRPFANILLGGANDQGPTNPQGAKVAHNHFTVMEFGGGVDYALTSHIAARVQGSAPLYLFFGPVSKGARFQIGMVYTFFK